MTAKPTKRPPLNPVLAWMPVQRDSGQIKPGTDPYVVVKRRDIRVFSDEVLIPIEIRERSKSLDSRLRRAARILLIRMGNTLIGYECGHGVSFEQACPDCKAGPVPDSVALLGERWPAKPSAELHVRRETQVLGAGQKPRRAAGKGRK
jgi:hypothetical protein